MQGNATTYIAIPENEWKNVQQQLSDILEKLGTVMNYSKSQPAFQVNYMTALEFMAAVKIKRTKFDMLVRMSKIKILKKKRKIYVPVTEIERYFKDATV